MRRGFYEVWSRHELGRAPTLLSSLLLMVFAGHGGVKRHQLAHRVFPEQPHVLIVVRREAMRLIAGGCRIVRHVVPGSAVQSELFSLP